MSHKREHNQSYNELLVLGPIYFIREICKKVRIKAKRDIFV